MGSSVPRCPTLLVSNTLPDVCTTSCDVMPPGLSMTRMPFMKSADGIRQFDPQSDAISKRFLIRLDRIVRIAFRFRNCRIRFTRLRLDLVQQLLDPHVLFDRLVVFEDQLRDSSQMMQPLGQRRLTKLAADRSPAALSFARPSSPRTVTKTRACRRSGETFTRVIVTKPNARILNFAFDDLAELDAQLFFDSIDSSALHILDNLDVALNHAFRRDALGSSSACSSVCRTNCHPEPTVTTLICDRCHSS